MQSITITFHFWSVQSITIAITQKTVIDYHWRLRLPHVWSADVNIYDLKNIKCLRLLRYLFAKLNQDHQGSQKSSYEPLWRFQAEILSPAIRGRMRYDSTWHDCVMMHSDSQGRAGFGGKLVKFPPDSPLQRPPIMTFICFKKNIRLKNCRDSEDKQEYNSYLPMLR